MTEPIVLLSYGPVENGISRFGRALAESAVAQGFRGHLVAGIGTDQLGEPAALDGVAALIPAGVRVVHLQFNDWMFGGPGVTPEARIGRFADRLAAVGCALSLTLHDVPQPAVARELFLRRASTYLAVVDRAACVVVCSEHERALLHEAAAAIGRGGDLTRRHIDVIPLPIDRMPGIRTDGPATSDDRGCVTVGILGFVYPGKGHGEVLDELAGMSPPPLVTAIGRPSDGHFGMLAELGGMAAQRGIGFSCTGFLPEHQLITELGRVTVAVAPHPQVSASASINSWIGAGRRPLVLDGRYTRELDERMPGAVWIYRSGQLRARVQEAIADPELTLVPRVTRISPNLPEVAARYLARLRQLARLRELACPREPARLRGPVDREIRHAPVQPEMR